MKYLVREIGTNNFIHSDARKDADGTIMKDMLIAFINKEHARIVLDNAPHIVPPGQKWEEFFDLVEVSDDFNNEKVFTVNEVDIVEKSDLNTLYPPESKDNESN